MIRRYGKLLTVLALPALYAGCNDYNFTEPKRAFEVTPQFAGIDEGTTLQLQATSGGNPVAVTWSSDDEKVVKVSSTGLGTAVAPGGPVGVIAKLTSDPTQTGSSSITVNKLQGTPVQKGVPLTIAGTAGTQALYRIFVPAGTTSLNITISGGTGDVDLYVRRGQPPTGSSSTDACRSFNDGNGESCTIANPQSGTWYMLLDAFATYAGATLLATYTP
jgi:serine protease